MPEASIHYVTLEEEMAYMYSLMTNPITKQQYCDYVNMKIYHFINTFYKISIKDFLTQFIEDKYGNIYLFYATVVDLDAKESDLKTPNFSHSSMIGNAIFRKIEKEEEGLSKTQDQFGKKKKNVYDDEVKKLQFSMKNKFKSTVNQFRVRADEIKVANSFMDSKLRKLRETIKGVKLEERDDRVRRDVATRKENLRRYIQELRKNKLLNQEGTSSFKTPERTINRIQLLEGHWLHLEINKKKAQKLKKGREKLRRMLKPRKEKKSRNRQRGMRFKVDTYRGNKSFDHTMRIFKKYPKLENPNRSFYGNTTDSFLDTFNTNQSTNAKWVWKPSSQDFNRMPIALTPEEIVQPNLSLEKVRKKTEGRTFAESDRENGLPNLLFNDVYQV